MAHRLGERRFFLPYMERMFSLSFIQLLSLWRSMEQDLIEDQSKVSLGQILHHTAVPVDLDKDVIGLMLVSLEAEYPASETPCQVTIFINQFMDIKGDFPPSKF